jgi:hypothetical protein
MGRRYAHAANAAATFIVFVCAIVFAAIDGTVREPAHVRSTAQVQSQSQTAQAQ